MARESSSRRRPSTGKRRQNDDHEIALNFSKSPLPSAIFWKDLCVSPQFPTFKRHSSDRQLCRSHFSPQRGNGREEGSEKCGQVWEGWKERAIHLSGGWVRPQLQENLWWSKQVSHSVCTQKTTELLMLKEMWKHIVQKSERMSENCQNLTSGLRKWQRVPEEYRRAERGRKHWDEMWLKNKNQEGKSCSVWAHGGVGWSSTSSLDQTKSGGEWGACQGLLHNMSPA